VCETPKSPPGDYNAGTGAADRAGGARVKHLNPRQGITTRRSENALTLCWA